MAGSSNAPGLSAEQASVADLLHPLGRVGLQQLGQPIENAPCAFRLFGLLGKEASAARAAELAPNVIKEQENAAIARVSTQLCWSSSVYLRT